MILKIQIYNNFKELFYFLVDTSDPRYNNTAKPKGKFNTLTNYKRAI